jgi:uncharacterized membrane protein YjfL (UPF0719 family)
MDLPTWYVASFGAGTILVLIVLHRVLQSVLVGRQSLKADLLGENRAFALREVGDVLAVFLVGAAVVRSTVHGESGIVHDVVWCAAFAVTGLFLLEIVTHFGLRLLLQRRLNASIERGNLAAGIAASAHYLAMGVLTSRAMAGTDLHGLGLSVTFFALGVVTHALMLALFRALTTYDDAEQIDGGNVAAALSYGGVSLALSLVIARALEGDFVDWPSALLGFASLSLCALALYPIRQLVVQGLVIGERPALRGGALDLAIGRDRNTGAAALEAACLLGCALALIALA